MWLIVARRGISVTERQKAAIKANVVFDNMTTYSAARRISYFILSVKRDQALVRKREEQIIAAVILNDPKFLNVIAHWFEDVRLLLSH